MAAQPILVTLSELDAGIVEWVNTFELSTPCSSLSDLSDGVTLLEVLHEISPGLFDPDRINRSEGPDWAVKFINLKRLLFHLEMFYRESLGRNSDFSSSVDLAGLARDASSAGIRVLVQLLVGAVVSCGHKARYIQRIMAMSEKGQRVMKEMVEEYMAESKAEGECGGRGGGDEDEEWSLRLVEEVWSVRLEEAKTSMTSLAKERDQEASSKRAVEKEMAILKESLHEMEAYALARDEETTTMSASIKRLNENLEEKAWRLQRALQDTRVIESKLDEEIKLRMDKEVELRQLEDELNMAKAKATQLTEVEATLEHYRKRVEEMRSLREQNQQLEALNAKYLDQVVKLDYRAKTIPNLKSQMNQYKNEAVELKRQRLEATSAVIVKDTEVMRLREDLEDAIQAKVFFKGELDELRNQNRAHAEALEEDPWMASQRELFAGAANRAELREKVARQEQEIELLKAQIVDGGMEGGEGLSRVEVLEMQLEHALRVKDDRSAEALSAKRYAADLEHKVNKLQAVKEKLESYTETLSTFQDKCMVAIAHCKTQLAQKEEKIDYLEGKIAQGEASEREERLMTRVYQLSMDMIEELLRFSVRRELQ